MICEIVCNASCVIVTVSRGGGCLLKIATGASSGNVQFLQDLQRALGRSAVQEAAIGTCWRGYLEDHPRTRKWLVTMVSK